MSVRYCFLSPAALNRLDWACRPVRRAFGAAPYLVGSVMTSPNFRDIDLRLILSDKRYRALTRGEHDMAMLLNIAIGDLIAATANQTKPIDFQIQPQSEANRYDGVRNPMGRRWDR